MTSDQDKEGTVQCPNCKNTIEGGAFWLRHGGTITCGCGAEYAASQAALEGLKQLSDAIDKTLVAPDK
jgi:hypothetical protein